MKPPSSRKTASPIMHATWRWCYGALGRFPVILSSATPSLELLVNVERAALPACDAHRPASVAREAAAEIELIDMRKAALPARRSGCRPSFDRGGRKRPCAHGEQALLFLNRRGYAPLTLCRACGHRIECPQLLGMRSSSTASAGQLLCHHCGHQQPVHRAARTAVRRAPSCLADRGSSGWPKRPVDDFPRRGSRFSPPISIAGHC